MKTITCDMPGSGCLGDICADILSGEEFRRKGTMFGSQKRGMAKIIPERASVVEKKPRKAKIGFLNKANMK